MILANIPMKVLESPPTPYSDQTKNQEQPQIEQKLTLLLTGPRLA